jgi:hypothetical protein
MFLSIARAIARAVVYKKEKRNKIGEYKGFTFSVCNILQECLNFRSVCSDHISFLGCTQSAV